VASVATGAPLARLLDPLFTLSKIWSTEKLGASARRIGDEGLEKRRCLEGAFLDDGNVLGGPGIVLVHLDGYNQLPVPGGPTAGSRRALEYYYFNDAAIS